MDPPSQRKKRLPSNPFTSEAKKRLCSLVKSKPLLWKLSEPLHRRPDAQAVAWEEIGQILNIDASCCKKQWKSLKDSLRVKKNKLGPSGDSGDEGDSDSQKINETSVLEGWMFWEDMKFIDENRPQRNTISTPIDPVDETSSSDSGPCSTQIAESTPVSNYSYMCRKRKLEQSTTESILGGINDLVKLRKEESAVANMERLKFHSMYANLDRLLCKLPEQTVENLSFEFYNLAYGEFKKATASIPPI